MRVATHSKEALDYQQRQWTRLVIVVLSIETARLVIKVRVAKEIPDKKHVLTVLEKQKL